MANLIKRGRVWYGRWWQDGKPAWKSLSEDRVIAQQKFTEILINLRAKKNGDGPKTISWQDFKEKYLAFSRTTKAPTSLVRDEIIFKNLEEAVDVGRLTDISAELMEQFKQVRKDAGIQSSTINREVNTIKSALKRAKQWGYQVPDLSSVAKLPLPKKKPIFFSTAEIDLMLETAEPFMKTIVLLGFYAGLRLGEMLSLEWANLDWDRHILKVTPKPHWHPKDYDERAIPMNPTLEAHLKAWQAVSGQKVKVVLWSAPPCQLSSRFNFFLRKRCKIMQGSLHTLRHSFASHMAMADVSPYKIARLLGHSDIRTTEIYSHLFPSSLQEAVNRLPGVGLPPVKQLP